MRRLFMSPVALALAASAQVAVQVEHNSNDTSPPKKPETPKPKRKGHFVRFDRQEQGKQSHHSYVKGVSRLSQSYKLS